MEENKIMNEEMELNEENVPEAKDDATYIDLAPEKESEGKDVSTLVIGATVVLTAAAIGGAIWAKNRVQNWWGNRKKKKDSDTVVDAEYEEVDEAFVNEPEKDPENDKEPSKKK